MGTTPASVTSISGGSKKGRGRGGGDVGSSTPHDARYENNREQTGDCLGPAYGLCGGTDVTNHGLTDSFIPTCILTLEPGHFGPSGTVTAAPSGQGLELATELTGLGL